MPVYTVHAPSAAAADLRATDKFTFVRDGFHFWAMVFGPFWLIWNWLWLALIVWIFAVVALALGIAATTVMFSVIYNVVFDPFPYRDTTL